MKLAPKVGDLVAWEQIDGPRVGEVTERLTRDRWRVRVIGRLAPGERPSLELTRSVITAWWRKVRR